MSKTVAYIGNYSNEEIEQVLIENGVTKYYAFDGNFKGKVLYELKGEDMMFYHLGGFMTMLDKQFQFGKESAPIVLYNVLEVCQNIELLKKYLKRLKKYYRDIYIFADVQNAVDYLFMIANPITFKNS